MLIFNIILLAVLLMFLKKVFLNVLVLIVFYFVVYYIVLRDSNMEMARVVAADYTRMLTLLSVALWIVYFLFF